ncbi:MAG: cyclic nucleotide-binding domain-containing protein [Cyanobacteria bacterium P01_F01_bin.150]
MPTVPWKLNRLTQLLLLAATVLVYSVMGMTVANSLFVSHVGAGQLPFAFILIGLSSMPAYAIFSQIVNRSSRPKLFRYVLLGSIVLAIALRFFLTLNATPVYYLLLIFIFFQWDFHNNVLYPSLLTDYFTTLEYKRYVPFVGIAQAAGTLVGGGVTAILSQWISTRDLLLCLPVTFAIAIAQLLYLERSQRPIVTQPEEKIGLIESITSFPDLAKRYPVAWLLASSSFLLVIIYISSEFLWFNIYGQSFTERELTSFLGLMRIAISLIQVIVIYGLTRPLLQNVGVARMNTVYPFTTLVSLVGLAFNVNVPAAIALHINGDALYKAINVPVHQLNYNAIPKEFIGRIRTLSDGFIYAFGLTVAGIALLICHHWLSLSQITAIAAGLSIILLLVRWPMGRFYSQGLEDMIRSNTIDLDTLNDFALSLPSQSSTAIQSLLTSNDDEMQYQGIKLVANYDPPSEFLAELELLLQKDNDEVRQQALKLFTQSQDPLLRQRCIRWIKTNCRDLQTFALEVLICQPESSDDQRATSSLIESFETHDDPTLRLLGQWAAGNIEISPQLIGQGQAIQLLGRMVTYSANRAFLPLVTDLLPSANTVLTQKLLKSLHSVTTLEDQEVTNIALSQTNHDDPLIRTAAFKLLGKTRWPDCMHQVANGCGDRDPHVRQQAALALANYGKAGVNLAKQRLGSSNSDEVRSAIVTIGQVRTKYASDILFDYLAPHRQLLAKTRKWQSQLPSDSPIWQPLAIALEDYHQRQIDRVLYILSCLGYSHTVNTVNRILATSDHQNTENAIEVLASLRHRRFIAPVLPLLEQRIKNVEGRRQKAEIKAEGRRQKAEEPTPSPSEEGDRSSATLQIPKFPNSQNPKSKIQNPKSKIQSPQWLRTKGYRILLEALEVSDRWIKTGAMIALAQVPSALVSDADPFVRTIAHQLFPSVSSSIVVLSPVPDAMNRILLLKNVAIFKNLSLDELQAIDQALEQEQVLAGQTIYTEGNWGSHFYIITQGQIRIVKTLGGQQQDIRLLSKEQYFGEIALFDDAPRWDGAIALVDTTLLKLEKSRFISLVSQRPHIILEACRFLSQRLRETDAYPKAIQQKITSEDNDSLRLPSIK